MATQNNYNSINNIKDHWLKKKKKTLITDRQNKYKDDEIVWNIVRTTEL